MLLKGVTASELLQTLEQIPLSVGAEFVTQKLKERGHFLVIISDSYTLATKHLKEKLNFDWTIANELLIVDGFWRAMDVNIKKGYTKGRDI